MCEEEGGGSRWLQQQQQAPALSMGSLGIHIRWQQCVHCNTHDSLAPSTVLVCTNGTRNCDTNNFQVAAVTCHSCGHVAIK